MLTDPKAAVCNESAWLSIAFITLGVMQAMIIICAIKKGISKVLTEETWFAFCLFRLIRIKKTIKHKVEITRPSPTLA